jgi:hypothetical protein
MSNPWDRDKLVERANARAHEIAGLAASTLYKKHDLSSDLLASRKKTAQSGVGLLTLEKAARCLKWTVPQLMGIEETRALDEAKLRIAARLIEDATGGSIPPVGENFADFLAHWIKEAYEIVDDVSVENPDSWQSEESFRAMAPVFRKLVNARPPS